MRNLLLAATLVGALGLGTDCFAQSLFPTQPSGGGGGNRGTGGATSGLGGTGGMGMNAGGLGGMGGQGGGQGGMGRQNGGMGSGMAQPQFNAADGTLGQQVGQGAFVGRSDDATFIGNRFAGQQNNVGQTPQFGNLQGLGQGMNRGQNGGFNSAMQNDRRFQIRPQMRIGFQTPDVSYSPAVRNALARISATPAFANRLTNVEFDMTADGTAVLSGQVESDSDRRLLESFIRLEPGVRTVRNELTVAP